MAKDKILFMKYQLTHLKMDRSVNFCVEFQKIHNKVRITIYFYLPVILPAYF